MWQKARPDDSTMIDVAAMMKAHSCGEHRYSNNLPFSVDNKWRLLGMMVVFFGSGFAFPFIVVRHQILKKFQPEDIPPPEFCPR
ncbi:Cytochrome c oxidase subunit 7C, mitochondrial [Takifugu flavidus]|uniref:Cytochrome c oxidase subunit 7C, mitochondrial n=1 Tax=Takifugu flavidus TaxID=433684 RepID=A0A5C6MZA0_9TELE|nr:Cytochrome c oxidase subunit 7C, mitochondrial [Takifugu flavidus]